MNSTFNTSSDENFNTAVNMSEQEYDYEALMEFIESGSLVEKQISVLNLGEIKSKEDAKILVANLVNQDGKVREVVALKVNELIKKPEYTSFFYDAKIYETFLKAIVDVNANICRLIIDVACFLKENEEFKAFLIRELPIKIDSVIKKLDAFHFDDKKHVVNKTIFKLYWYLETLYDFDELIEFDVVKKILMKAGVFYDYTIREKVAKILNYVTLNSFQGRKVEYSSDKDLSELKNNLINDENYYVRRLLN